MDARATLENQNPKFWRSAIQAAVDAATPQMRTGVKFHETPRERVEVVSVVEDIDAAFLTEVTDDDRQEGELEESQGGETGDTPLMKRVRFADDVEDVTLGGEAGTGAMARRSRRRRGGRREEAMIQEEFTDGVEWDAEREGELEEVDEDVMLGEQDDRRDAALRERSGVKFFTKLPMRRVLFDILPAWRKANREHRVLFLNPTPTDEIHTRATNPFNPARLKRLLELIQIGHDLTDEQREIVRAFIVEHARRVRDAPQVLDSPPETMDPFSLATGIAGLIQFAAALAAPLIQIARDYRGARESHQRLVSELEAMSSTLSMLQGHIATQAVQIPAVLFLQEPVDQCRATLEKIRAECLPPTVHSSRLRRLAWVYADERRVNDFITRLERYKTMFTLALQMDLSGQVDGVRLGISGLSAQIDGVRSGISALSDGAAAERLRAADDKNAEHLRNLLDWMKPLPMDSRLHAILELHHPDTCKWLLENALFQGWKSTKGSLLWLNGIAGSGKTVISSVVIDHLLQTCTSEEVVLYTFCEFRNQQSINPGAILCTLFSGLLRSYPGEISVDFDDLIREERKRQSPPQTVTRLLKLMRTAIPAFKRIYLVLDGLDECDSRSELLEFLPALASDNDLHVFVSSRQEEEIREAFCNASIISLGTQTDEVDGDIKLYISHELENRRELARLPRGLKDEIQATLESKASGMFRLVECQLDVLAKKTTTARVRLALQSLPEKLFDVYDRILRRIPEDTADIARRALRWLADVRRPIRLDQLVEAITIESGAMELNTEYSVSSNSVVLDILSSLVKHDASDDSVSLSHMSVLEYLMSSYLLQTPFSHYCLPSPAVLANEMLSLLLDYMLLTDFDRPQLETEDEFVQLSFEQHPFYEYATVWWMHYIPYIDISRPATLKALSRFIQSTNGCHALGHQVGSVHASRQFKKYDYLNHPLRLLYVYGVDSSIAAHLPSLDLPSDLIQCCLATSILAGDRGIQMMESLLKFGGADVHGEHRCRFESESGHSNAPRSPLAYALDAGNLVAVRSLIEYGANPSHVLIDGWTMLHSAALCGRVEAVKMILDDPSFTGNVHARDYCGRTAYMIALQMETGTEVVRYLESKGASEELDLDAEIPKNIDKKAVIQVGLCLAQMLRTASKLVPVILDLAEYWAVSSAKRSTPNGAIYDQNSPDEPYVTLKISGRTVDPLRRLIFITESRDQGWSDHTAHIGSYRESCSWFETRNASMLKLKPLRFQYNLHGSSKARVHRNVWVNDHTTWRAISDWMGMFRAGDILEVHARAAYPGWKNIVNFVEIVAYTSCL
ncbi:ANK-REP-REGION domain-containing protein [Mycena sanguinolenta]|uniref:ANK-REP-REGION domain-containing protein n=1 Tax=Mycena sanguinolenta TaxID=230812 RepID=A0A8H6ZHN1_9AGAR|nr:ANK-REP-REGION domain-containing protein [Mycena sanguinolenta]